MTTDESLTLYAAVYDADNNYLQDMNVNWSTSGDLEDINLFGNSILFEPELAFSSGTIIISSRFFNWRCNRYNNSKCWCTIISKNS